MKLLLTFLILAFSFAYYFYYPIFFNKIFLNKKIDIYKSIGFFSLNIPICVNFWGQFDEHNMVAEILWSGFLFSAVALVFLISTRRDVKKGNKS